MILTLLHLPKSLVGNNMPTITKVLRLYPQYLAYNVQKKEVR